MTKEELDRLIAEQVAKYAPKIIQAYEDQKVASKKAYDAAVGEWGRRLTNAALVLGTIALSFAAGYFFRGM